MKRFRQVFKEEEDFLPTFNDQLDDLQVGGFPAGCVTELVGESGSGKTQLCLQLCANVQVPAEIGGLEGKAVFFDCHGGFSKRRFDEIATATKGIALDILRDSENASEAELEEFAKKDFGVGLLYRKMHSSSDLLESLKQLESEILPKNPEIRLVIIDRYLILSDKVEDFNEASIFSIAFHFRYLLENNVTGTLFQVIQKLNELTSKWNLISVVTNQMTVRKPFFENGILNCSWLLSLYSSFSN